jgi:hypothetical protein
MQVILVPGKVGLKENREPGCERGSEPEMQDGEPPGTADDRAVHWKAYPD